MSQKPIHKQSEKEFQASMHARFQAQTKGIGSMHMTPAPTGKSLSLDELLDAEKSGEQATTAVVANDAPPSSGTSAAAPDSAPPGAGGQMVTMPGQHPMDGAILEVDWQLVEDWKPYLNREVLIPLDLIVDSPYQSKAESARRYDESSLIALGETMADGLQQEAIQVRWVLVDDDPGGMNGAKGAKGRFELVAGHRRVRAARLNEWTHIRAIIRDYNDRDAQLALYITNRGRKDEFDFRLGKIYNDLYNHEDPAFRRTQREIARLFATNQTTVSKCINMLKLPEPILAMLESDPGLFNSNTSDTIRGLVESYPDSVDIITRAVERLKQPGVTESSIKPWVTQMVAQRRGGSQRKPLSAPGDRLVTSRDGAPLVSMSARGRTVRVRIEDPRLDEQTVAEMIFNLLHGSSQKLISKDHEEESKSQ